MIIKKISASDEAAFDKLTTCRIFLNCVLFFCFHTFMACNDQDPLSPIQHISAKITDGNEDTNHPYVGLLLIGANAGVSDSICTAFVVGKKTILTAAHCLDATKDNLIKFDTTTYPIKKVLPHPSYKASVQIHHDLGFAFSEVELPIPFVEISLSPPTKTAQVTLVGMGRTSLDLQDSGVKRMASNTIEDVLEDHFTTQGTGSGEGNTCKGDSGGPVLLSIQSQEQAIGLISTSMTPCGVRSYHVKLNNYLDWLIQEGGGDVHVADHEGPQINLESPLDGAQVEPTFQLQVSAIDNLKFRTFEIYLDGELLFTSNLSTLDKELTASPGPHVLKLIATDTMGNQTSKEVRFIVGKIAESGDSSLLLKDAELQTKDAGFNTSSRPTLEGGCNFTPSPGGFSIVISLLLSLLVLHRLWITK